MEYMDESVVARMRDRDSSEMVGICRYLEARAHTHADNTANWLLFRTNNTQVQKKLRARDEFGRSISAA